ncbi:MAG: hypothetical protein ABW005_11515 [Burkholderiaceae bacterium]
MLSAGSTLSPAQGGDGLLTPLEHRRPPDQTFLTFAEWYLVHSPAEYAAYLGRGAEPSRFPLFSHIGQFWSSYRAVSREIQRYPFNGGYHLMVMVIGSRTTVEYGFKGLYEHTVGRLAEATRSGAPVPEERFAAAFAQDYVDFIRVEPWYQFDFLSRLKRLWSEVPTAGPDLPRRWERRFALSSELLVKEGYARLIKLGTQSLYDAPTPVTAVLLSAEARADPQHPDYVRLPTPAAVLATVPRYDAFTAYSLWLAGQGLDFREIAGNRDEVLVSLLVPQGWQAGGEVRSRQLFAQPVLTRAGIQRLVLATPISQLGQLLRQVVREQGAAAVEHVYDF